MKKILPLLIVTLTLTGCISREQADERLFKGCTAAAQLFLDEYFKIKTVKNKKFSPSLEFGNGFREVTIFAVESDGWLDIDNEYKCVFAEEMGLFSSTHRATLYQMKIKGKTYGIDGDKLSGDINTHINIKQVVEQAMNE